MASNTGMDIHNYKGMLDRYIAVIKSSKEINEKNTQTLLEYHTALVNEGLAVPTQLKHMQTFKVIAEKLGEKTFQEVERKDIENLISWIRKNKISPWTVHKYLVCLKKFFKWFRKTDEYPPEVKWIKSTVKDSQLKLPEHMLKQDEVKKIINACENPRDKCLISLLNELGCRVGELLTLNINNFEDCGDYYRVTMQHSKTTPRRLKIVDSKSFIAKWLNQHSKLQKENSPLFIGLGKRNKNERISYDAARMLLQKAAKRAGIKKAVNPHQWRHSTATRYSNFMQHAQLCKWFGWKVGSQTANVYIHLSGQDLDEAVDSMRGKKTVKKFEDTLSQKTCSQCGKENEGTDDLCVQCGAALSIQGILHKENDFKIFQEDIKSRQKVLEEYITFQNKKMQKMEAILEEKAAKVKVK